MRYKFGSQVPKSFEDALRLDKENANSGWQDAVELDKSQINYFHVFKDEGKAVGKMSNLGLMSNMMGDTKQEVDDGYPSKEPVHTVYSGDISVRSLRLVIFLVSSTNLNYEE